MITYEPSPHFKQNLRTFADHLAIKWRESTETLEIWSTLPNKVPVMEHSFNRNNRSRKKPLLNWDMEWIVLQQLNNGRKWQHLSAQEFQDDMLSKRDKIKADGEKEADQNFNDFMSDKYWHKKRLQENDDNDFGACTTQWAGTNPEGNKNNDENLEPQPLHDRESGTEQLP